MSKKKQKISAEHAARALALFEDEIAGPADTDAADEAVAKALRSIVEGAKGAGLTAEQASHAAGFARAYRDFDLLAALEGGSQ